MKRSLRKARKEKFVTVKELAVAAGVSPQTITNYESGKCNPSLDTWKKLQRALDLKGPFESWFTPKDVTRYGEKDRCRVPGCKKRPTARGFCFGHYINAWRRAKRLAEKNGGDVIDYIEEA